MDGIFITFEGPDGAGKSTAIQSVLDYLTPRISRTIILTREPGGIPIAEEIREVILDPKNTAMDERTEALLYAAARRQHLVEKVFPALVAGKLVLCDRFVDSSLAYQGAGRGIGIDKIAQMNEFATGGKQPDLTLYFDLPVEIGLNRIKKNRQGDIDRLDQETVAFHERVREGYLQVREAHEERIVTIDATKKVEEVAQDVLAVIQQRFPNLMK